MQRNTYDVELVRPSGRKTKMTVPVEVDFILTDENRAMRLHDASIEGLEFYSEASLEDAAFYTENLTRLVRAAQELKDYYYSLLRSGLKHSEGSFVFEMFNIKRYKYLNSPYFQRYDDSIIIPLGGDLILVCDVTTASCFIPHLGEEAYPRDGFCSFSAIYHSAYPMTLNVAYTPLVRKALFYKYSQAILLNHESTIKYCFDIFGMAKENTGNADKILEFMTQQGLPMRFRFEGNHTFESRTFSTDGSKWLGMNEAEAMFGPDPSDIKFDQKYLPYVNHGEKDLINVYITSDEIIISPPGNTDQCAIWCAVIDEELLVNDVDTIGESFWVQTLKKAPKRPKNTKFPLPLSARTELLLRRTAALYQVSEKGVPLEQIGKLDISAMRLVQTASDSAHAILVYSSTKYEYRTEYEEYMTPWHIALPPNYPTVFKKHPALIDRKYPDKKRILQIGWRDLKSTFANFYNPRFYTPSMESVFPKGDPKNYELSFCFSLDNGEWQPRTLYAKHGDFRIKHHWEKSEKFSLIEQAQLYNSGEYVALDQVRRKQIDPKWINQELVLDVDVEEGIFHGYPTQSLDRSVISLTELEEAKLALESVEITKNKEGPIPGRDGNSQPQDIDELFTLFSLRLPHYLRPAIKKLDVNYLNNLYQCNITREDLISLVTKMLVLEGLSPDDDLFLEKIMTNILHKRDKSTAEVSAKKKSNYPIKTNIVFPDRYKRLLFKFPNYLQFSDSASNQSHPIFKAARLMLAATHVNANCSEEDEELSLDLNYHGPSIKLFQTYFSMDTATHPYVEFDPRPIKTHRTTYYVTLLLCPVVPGAYRLFNDEGYVYRKSEGSLDISLRGMREPIYQPSVAVNNLCPSYQHPGGLSFQMRESIQVGEDLFLAYYRVSTHAQYVVCPTMDPAILNTIGRTEGPYASPLLYLDQLDVMTQWLAVINNSEKLEKEPIKARAALASFIGAVRGFDSIRGDADQLSFRMLCEYIIEKRWRPISDEVGVSDIVRRHKASSAFKEIIAGKAGQRCTAITYKNRTENSKWHFASWVDRIKNWISPPVAKPLNVTIRKDVHIIRTGLLKHKSIKVNAHPLYRNNPLMEPRVEVGRCHDVVEFSKQVNELDMKTPDWNGPLELATGIPDRVIKQTITERQKGQLKMTESNAHLYRGKLIHKRVRPFKDLAHRQVDSSLKLHYAPLIPSRCPDHSYDYLNWSLRVRQCLPLVLPSEYVEFEPTITEMLLDRLKWNDTQPPQPLVQVDEYISVHVEPRKQKLYRNGWNTYHYLGKFPEGLVELPKMYEPQIAKHEGVHQKADKYKLRFLGNPSDQEKVFMGLFNHNATKIIKNMFRGDLALALTPSQLKRRLLRQRQRLKSPVTITFDGARHDAHQHLFLFFIDAILYLYCLFKVGPLLGFDNHIMKRIERLILDHERMLVYKMSGPLFRQKQLAPVLEKVWISGTVYSGQYNTSSGNSSRVATFHHLICKLANIRTNWDYQDNIHSYLNQSGDDTLINHERDQVSAYLTKFVEVYELNPYKIGGLGQHATDFKIRFNDFEFLGKEGRILDYAQIVELVRPTPKLNAFAYFYEGTEDLDKVNAAIQDYTRQYQRECYEYDRARRPAVVTKSSQNYQLIRKFEFDGDEFIPTNLLKESLANQATGFVVGRTSATPKTLGLFFTTTNSLIKNMNDSIPNRTNLNSNQPSRSFRRRQNGGSKKQKNFQALELRGLIKSLRQLHDNYGATIDKPDKAVAYYKRNTNFTTDINSIDSQFPGRNKLRRLEQAVGEKFLEHYVPGYPDMPSQQKMRYAEVLIADDITQALSTAYNFLKPVISEFGPKVFEWFADRAVDVVNQKFSSTGMPTEYSNHLAVVPYDPTFAAKQNPNIVQTISRMPSFTPGVKYVRSGGNSYGVQNVDSHQLSMFHVNTKYVAFAIDPSGPAARFPRKNSVPTSLANKGYSLSLTSDASGNLGLYVNPQAWTPNIAQVSQFNVGFVPSTGVATGGTQNFGPLASAVTANQVVKAAPTAFSVEYVPIVGTLNDQGFSEVGYWRDVPNNSCENPANPPWGFYAIPEGDIDHASFNLSQSAKNGWRMVFNFSEMDKNLVTPANSYVSGAFTQWLYTLFTNMPVSTNFGKLVVNFGYEVTVDPAQDVLSSNDVPDMGLATQNFLDTLSKAHPEIWQLDQCRATKLANIIRSAPVHEHDDLIAYVNEFMGDIKNGIHDPRQTKMTTSDFDQSMISF